MNKFSNGTGVSNRVVYYLWGKVIIKLYIRAGDQIFRRKYLYRVEPIISIGKIFVQVV